QEARVQLSAAGFQVTAETAAGTAEVEIADAVKNSGIDLLVMGAYGHSPIRHLVLGSTTTTMVRTCLVPVLMFR
ncbi:MAG: universal stress protein, partial [Verrucomicrobiaceae bacterium]